MAEETETNEEIVKFTIKIISTEYGELAIGNEDVVVFEMIEDIFSLCMVGKLMFFDRMGATEMLPFTGHEYISITYGVEETTKTFIIFDIPKIHQGTQAGGTTFTMIEMYLVEPLYLGFTQHRYSKSWKNKKISEIVNNICINIVGISEFYDFEATNEVLDYFYMPYWTPLEALKWLSVRASGAISKTAGYLLYSNANGWNFHTLENLFTSDDFETNDDGTIVKYVLQKTENENTESKILSWSIEPINYQSLSYLAGGHKFGYDFATKEFLDYDYEYTDIIDKYTMMGKKTLFPDVGNDNVQFVFEAETKEEILQNMAAHDWIRRYAKQFSLNIMVSGHERRYAGMMVDIPWRSAVKTEELHKMYEGKFLVRSVTHQFSGKMKPNFRQLLVCLKTAYTDADYKTLYKASNYNIKIPEKTV